MRSSYGPLRAPCVVAVLVLPLLAAVVTLMLSSHLTHHSADRATVLQRMEREETLAIPVIEPFAKPGTVVDGDLDFVDHVVDGEKQSRKSIVQVEKTRTVTYKDEETGQNVTEEEDFIANVTVWENVTVSGISTPNSVAVSPDGAFVYVLSDDDALAWFERDASDGDLFFAGSVSGQGLTKNLTFSADGSVMYVIDDTVPQIAVYERDISTGNVTLLETHTDTALTGVLSLALSQDGKNLYTCGESGTESYLATWDVDTSTGLLSLNNSEALGSTYSATTLAVALDDLNVYVGTFQDQDRRNGQIRIYSRDANTGILSLDEIFTDNFNCPVDLEIDVNDDFIYVAAQRNNRLVVLERSTEDGTLVTNDQVINGDISGFAPFTSINKVVVSGDGQYLYTSTPNNELITIFKLESLTPLPTAVPTPAPTLDDYPTLDPDSYTNATCSNLTCGMIWPSVEPDVEDSRFDSSGICGGACFSSQDGYCAEGSTDCQGVTANDDGTTELPTTSTYYEAVSFCEAGGARLCTVDEVAFDETADTGCWDDDALLWTSTACVVNSTGSAGYYVIAETARQPTEEAVCLEPEDGNTTVRVKCCAEVTCGDPTPSPTITRVPTGGPPSPEPTPPPTPKPTFKPTNNPTRTIKVTFESVVDVSSVVDRMTDITVSPDWENLYAVGGNTDNVAFFKRNATTPAPTPFPTTVPSPAPSGTPSLVPSPPPTIVPSPAPTRVPMPAPTGRPSIVPSPAPSAFPTEAPSPAPTTPAPSQKPTGPPSPEPTHPPTPSPTEHPTRVPTPPPSHAPSATPTHVPSHVPTPTPTHEPTPAPFGDPTPNPTPKPTTRAPTPYPTPVPTITYQVYIRPVNQSNYCWTLPKADTSSGFRNGLVPVLARCVNSKSQRWSFDLKRNEIHPQNNFDWCLDSDFDRAIRRPVTLFRCGKTFSVHAREQHQEWAFNFPVAGAIRNRGTGLCVSTGKEVYQGRYLQAWFCDDDNQDWEYVPAL